MKINLTTQTEILTIGNGDLNKNRYLYKYFYEELKDQLEKNPNINIKTLAYNSEINELVLLIFDKDGLTQRGIILGEPILVGPIPEETISGND